MTDAASPPPTRSLSHTVAYRARFDECGPDGTLRASGFLRWAQDLAWIHSELLGFTRGWYAERGLWWLVRCAELDLVGGVAMGETIDVTTTIVGYRKVWARRRTEFRRATGERVATTLTDWVVTDSRGAPTRVPAEFLALWGSGVATFTPGRVLLPPVPPDAVSRSVAIRAADVDPMAHVNNAAYVDYLEETFTGSMAAWRERLPRRYRLEYVAPAAPGDPLAAETWASGDGVACRLVGGDGAERLRATVDGLTAHDDFRESVAARRPWKAPGKDLGAG